MAAAAWLQWTATLLLSGAVLITAVVAEKRARRNESIRVRQLFINDVRQWANQTLSVLGETEAFAGRMTDRPNLLVRLSILIEQGRLFFQNVAREKFATEKSPAYRGFRPRILSWLVFFHSVASLDVGEDMAQQADILTALRQGFVSDCQELIYPRKFSLTILDLEQQFRDGNFMECADNHVDLQVAERFLRASHPARNFVRFL